MTKEEQDVLYDSTEGTPERAEADEAHAELRWILNYPPGRLKSMRLRQNEERMNAAINGMRVKMGLAPWTIWGKHDY